MELYQDMDSLTDSLWKFSQFCEVIEFFLIQKGMSGRQLKRIPFLTHAFHSHEKILPVSEFIEYMWETATCFKEEE